MNEIYKQNTKGNLIVISGPSGSGKDTIVNEYINTHDNAWVSVSCTSRAKRPGDEEGVSYYFLTKDEFQDKIYKGDFLEYAEYNGNFYGTPREYISEKLSKGIDVFLVIEVQGALNIKRLIPEAICIFILPPSMKELKRRLIARKTEDKDKIISRFKTAYQEINRVKDYNYVVVNDKIDDAVKKIESIIISSKCSVERIEELYINNEEEEMHELLMDETFINEDMEV